MVLCTESQDTGLYNTGYRTGPLFNHLPAFTKSVYPASGIVVVTSHVLYFHTDVADPLIDGHSTLAAYPCYYP